MQGRTAEAMASQLTSQLKQLLLARDAAGPALGLRRLSVAAGRVCWRLSLDCVALAAGSPLVDALGAAARLALRDVRVPAAAVAAADAGPDIILGAADVDVDGDASAAVALDISQLPLIVSACQVRLTTWRLRPPPYRVRAHNPLKAKLDMRATSTLTSSAREVLWRLTSAANVVTLARSWVGTWRLHRRQRRPERPPRRSRSRWTGGGASAA
jgi:hypothetical protein